MASEIEVVHAQREAQSDPAAQVEDSAAGSLVRSGTLAETVSRAPMGPPKPPFKNSRQLALELQEGQDGLRYSSENSQITMQIFLVKRKEEIDELLARRAENSRKISALI